MKIRNKFNGAEYASATLRMTHTDLHDLYIDNAPRENNLYYFEDGWEEMPDTDGVTTVVVHVEDTWHDVAEHPFDIPQHSNYVIVCCTDHNGGYHYTLARYLNINDIQAWGSDGFLIDAYRIKAWCEIPCFKGNSATRGGEK